MTCYLWLRILRWTVDMKEWRWFRWVFVVGKRLVATCCNSGRQCWRMIYECFHTCAS